jgi:hypothetical protein
MAATDDIMHGEVISRPTARGRVTFLPEPEPREVWCPLISVDDHLLEPPDLFSARVPAAVRESVPQFGEDDEGVPY